MKTIPPSELSRTIAELLESILTLDKPHAFAIAKCWYASNAGPWDDGSTTTDWYWEPLDFEHDPRETLMLEHAMKCEIQPHVDGTATVRVWLFDKDWATNTNQKGWHDIFMTGQRGPIVARAFLRAHGVVVNE